MCVIYSKHFIPLESNPDVFNNLIYSLGCPRSLAFEDVLSLDEQDLLPRRPLALVFVFPTTHGYEMRKGEEDDIRDEHNNNQRNEDIVWLKQTINNACGLYAILHALYNSNARDMLVPDSLIKRIFEAYFSSLPDERSQVLEDSAELENLYAEVARQGTSSVPDNPEDEVDFHYVCFVQSPKSGHLYELDGDRKGPIDRGLVPSLGDDMLVSGGLRVVREYIEQEQQSNNFCLMALVHDG